MVLPTPKQVKLKKPKVRGKTSSPSGLSDSAIKDSTDLQAKNPDNLPISAINESPLERLPGSSPACGQDTQSMRTKRPALAPTAAVTIDCRNRLE
jgi:hypothetical protein